MAKSNQNWTIYTGKGNAAILWSYFERRIDKQEARCKQCLKVFKISTSTMKYHIEKIHNIKLESNEDCTQPKVLVEKGQTKITSSIPSLLKKQEANFALAEMAATDRVPFNTFAQSVQIRKGFKARGITIPISYKGVKVAVIQFGKKRQGKYNNGHSTQDKRKRRTLQSKS